MSSLTLTMHLKRTPHGWSLFFGAEGRKRLMTVGHLSFAFYSLLSLVAMEEDIKSDLPVVLLGRTAESAVSSRQKALALHQLGRVMLLSIEKPAGWAYQEMALYSGGKEKRGFLETATELDPTLLYPYKYRAAALMDEQKVHLAIVEIPSVLGFKVTPDYLELELGRGMA
ncbi:unnamed protein product [Calypogeia fissa]